MIDNLLTGSTPQFASRWVALTLAETKARLLQAGRLWEAADGLLRDALRQARPDDDRVSELRLTLLRLKGLVLMGCWDRASAMLAHLECYPFTLESFCRRSAILSVASRAAGFDSVSAARMQRAERVAEALCNHTLLRECEFFKTVVPVTMDETGASAEPTDLDTAVALLDLGGHPHLLGREAVAVLGAAGCARGVALVAAGAGGPRVIEHAGWDEREALAAARKTEPYDLVPLGHHRDEPWQLIVDPEPGIEHRCTFVAIRKLIATAVTLDRYRREEKQRAALWPAEALDGDPESVWASEQVSEVLSIARRIAPTPLSILVTGETGTGKEMLARTIHRASDRADKTFLPFNCTAVPRDMLESQLFGFRKGAFTGADAAFPGVIRSAAGGTLFLDEIAEIGLDVQPKLLRFLETHEIHPLGEPQPVKVDVRVIAATNAPLEQLVAEGRLREDLFYRLNVVRLRLPPLRERREEIPPLVEHYLRRFGDEQKKGRLTLSDEALEYLLLYAWPGNVRQLANEVRRVVAMAEPGATVTPAHLSPEIQASRRTIPAGSPSEPEIRLRIDQPLPAAVLTLEQTMVRNALTRSHGRVEEAARLLGISRKGLFLKRRRWGLELPS
jgi:DNA-binding NtrC family response regulator